MAEKWETTGGDEFHFHSSRKERLESAGPVIRTDKRGFFRRNPSFKIFILDLLLIAIISGVIVPYLFKREGTAELEGYRLVVRAFNFDDKVMVSLSVSGRDKSINTGSLLEVRFYGENPGEEAALSDLTPRSGEERILKGALDIPGEKYIFCAVVINGKNKTIKKKIN